MKLPDFLEKEQNALNQSLILKHGYELIWIGADLLSGSRVSPIKRQIKLGFLKQDVVGEFPVDMLVERDSLPFEENAIDLVVLSHALEFEKDPEILCEEIYRVLRPDGALFITGFNPAWRYCAKQFLKEMVPDYFLNNKKQNLYFRGPQCILSLSALCGFKLRKYDAFGFCENPAWEKRLQSWIPTWIPTWIPRFSRGYALLLEKQTIKLREIWADQEPLSLRLKPVFGVDRVDPKPCPSHQVNKANQANQKPNQ